MTLFQEKLNNSQLLELLNYIIEDFAFDKKNMSELTNLEELYNKITNNTKDGKIRLYMQFQNDNKNLSAVNINLTIDKLELLLNNYLQKSEHFQEEFNFNTKLL